AREAVRLAPYSSVAMRMLVTAYLGTNRVAEARQALRDAASRGVGDVVWHGLAFQVAFADGDAAAMLEQARWSPPNPLDAITMIQYRAQAAASSGRLREARPLWSEAARMAAQGAAPTRQAAIRMREAEMEALLGDARAAQRTADAALALDARPGTMLAAAVVFALAGDAARAGSLIDDAVRRTEPGICAKPVWLPVARALVEAASGQYVRARDTIGQVARFERGRDFGLAPLGARALIEIAAGRPREAAEIFQELLRLRLVAPTSPWVPFARLGLARALRAAGDIRGSRAAYDADLESMNSAEPDTPLLVAARQERAALGIR
ncbi:MAG: hypothetical protein NTY02_12850, partial [Acidobacteria bacterium]|nr:hypothetical protein [Acidobacteriota bacterium]